MTEIIRHSSPENIIDELKKHETSNTLSIDSVFDFIKPVSSPYTSIFHRIITSPTLSSEQKLYNAIAVKDQLLDDDSVPWSESTDNGIYKSGKSDEALLMGYIIKGMERKEALKISINEDNQISIKGETFSDPHTQTHSMN